MRTPLARPSSPSLVSWTSTALVASALLAGCGDDGAVASASASGTEGTTGTTGATTGEATSAASESEGGTGAECAPGEETGPYACNCPEGQGVGICGADGKWGGCECPGVHYCGDGLVDPNEECDEGEANANDGACTLECVAAACGDGLIYAGVEACDDGVNDGAYGGCMPGCAALGPRCGDGAVQGEEACDDGDAVEGNGCNSDCLVSGSEVWTRTYAGQDAGDAIAHGVAVDGAGNVIVVGEEFVVGQSANIWMRKYTSAGEVLWTRSVVGAGAGIDVARGVAAGADGSIVAVGQLAAQGSGQDFWVQKMDGAGKEVWTRTYDGPAGLGDAAHAVALDAAGNVYAVGSHYALIGLDNVVVRKLDGDGALLWTDAYDHKAGIDVARGVAVGADGYPVVAGQVYEPIGLADLWVRKYSSEGGQLWTTTYDHKGGNDIVRAVAIDAEDQAVIVGEVYAPIGLANVVVRRLDGAGAAVWTEIYDSAGSDNDVGRGVAVAPDGTIVAAGQEYTANDFAGVWARKYTTAGAALWTHTHDGDGAGDDIARAVAIGADGAVYVAGQEYAPGQFATLWLRKLNP